MDGMDSAAAMSYVTLADRLRAARPSCGRVRVVAVDGPSGAGKSTFAARLAEILGAPVVGSDDFRVPWDGDPMAWWPPFTRQVLDRLAMDRPGGYLRFDWRLGEYTDPVMIPVVPVLVVEGVGAARQGAPLSFRIWLDTPPDVRLARLAERDGPESMPLWHIWRASEEAHFAADRTRDHVDVVVDGQTTSTSAWAAPPDNVG